MKKILFLFLVVSGMCFKAESMTKALVETAKSLERRINVGQSISGIDLDFLTSVPQAMRAVSTETEITLCMEAVKKYINDKWEGKSTEELLSRVSKNTPFKRYDLMDTSDAYNYLSMGKGFFHWIISGYCFERGALYKSNLDNALRVISSVDLGNGAKIRDNAYSIDYVMTEVHNVPFGSENFPGNPYPILTIGDVNRRQKIVSYIYIDEHGEYQKDYVWVNEFSLDFAEQTIDAAAKAVVEVVIFNANATNDELCREAFRAAKEYIITRPPEQISNLRIELIDAVSNAIKEGILGVISNEPYPLDFLKRTTNVDNSHRLYLMGAMQAVIEGKGIPYSSTQSEAADGSAGKKLIDILNPDVDDETKRVFPWDYNSINGATDNQRRMAAQNYLKIARTLE